MSNVVKKHGHEDLVADFLAKKGVTRVRGRALTEGQVKLAVIGGTPVARTYAKEVSPENTTRRAYMPDVPTNENGYVVVNGHGEFCPVLHAEHLAKQRRKEQRRAAEEQAAKLRMIDRMKYGV